jgi:hypothetical protein
MPSKRRIESAPIDRSSQTGFDGREDPELLFPAPSSATDNNHKNAPDLTGRGRSLDLEHETGLASVCRFAAGAMR